MIKMSALGRSGPAHSTDGQGAPSRTQEGGQRYSGATEATATPAEKESRVASSSNVFQAVGRSPVLGPPHESTHQPERQTKRSASPARSKAAQGFTSAGHRWQGSLR